MRKSTLAIAVLLVCAASPAQAQAPDAAAPSIPSRYSFNRVDDGFLRLDNQTGQVAFCRPHAVGWACEAVAEDRAALEKEIARLQDEVASLQRQVAALREPSPPRPPGELTPPAADQREEAAKLREDFARARVAFENAWRRLIDMIINFQKDMMPKS